MGIALAQKIGTMIMVKMMGTGYIEAVGFGFI